MTIIQREENQTTKYGKKHAESVKSTDRIKSHDVLEVSESLAKIVIVKPDEITEVYTCSGADLCYVD